MITAERMAAVDANAEALGVPRKQLMESSGNAVARVVRDVAEPGDDVAIVCGRGNNGGDGFVAARFLSSFDRTVHLLGRPESISTEIARENWEALERAEIDARAVSDSKALELGDPDVVVDAMLGTGVSGALREPAATAAALLNAADATVVSVDVPSGIDADTGDVPSKGGTAVGDDADAEDDAATEEEGTTEDEGAVAVRADRVVTFHDAKPGLEELDARVTVADIGIPEAAERFAGPGDLRRLDRDPDSHKGDHGEVLVVGGGPYTGAPTLSARAALRAGADLARVVCPEHVAREVQGFSEDLIVHEFDGELLAPSSVDEVVELAADRDVVVLGPGIGGADETLDAVREFLAEYDGRAVVDADALQVVPEVDTDADLICTPHQGELKKMGGPSADDWAERAELVADFAAELGVTMLVKGRYDVVSDGDETRVNRTGNPGMTVGGTGDVLAGAVGALAARQPPLRAATIGAYVNGRAGDAVVEERGYGLVATDLIDALPQALYDE